MAITVIKRDTLPESVYIVRVVSSDTLATVATTGYLTTQISVLTALNNGIWNWLANDVVLVYASDGARFFTVSTDQTSLNLITTAGNGAVTLPVVSGDFTVFDGTLGALKDLGFSASDASKTKVVMAGSSVAVGNIAHFVDTAGTVDDTAGNVTNLGNISAGASGTAGTLVSFPATAANGSLIVSALNAGGAFNTTIRNSIMGQSSVISIPDPGSATAKFVLDTGIAAQLSVLNLKYGATPVAQVDPASCTIVAVAGATNTATVTVQLKDGSGTNMTRSLPFRVYASSAADGLTLASAASTGFSVASGGLSVNNGAAITTQISAMSSATGACVLSLLDTGKQTSYLVLVLSNGVKISAQLSAGSYG